MKNEKNYAGYFIIKIQQILKRFGRTKTLAKTSYFWGVDAQYFFANMGEILDFTLILM